MKTTLRDLIREEIRSLVTDDALYPTKHIPGTPPCRKCGGDHHANVCPGGHTAKKTSYMAKPQLAKIAKYASEIHAMIPDGEPIEDWMESHIAQMSDDIGEVYHALVGKKGY